MVDGGVKQHNFLVIRVSNADVLLAGHEQLKKGTILAQREGTSDETLKKSS